MTALHGFLGRGADWDDVLPGSWSRPDWLPLFDSAASLEDVASNLNQTAEGDVLLGYSMGGRIALHMLIADPQRWRRAVIVSASPGITESERPSRLANDQRWAQRFRTDDWDAVIADWNAQPVFSQDPPDRLPRRELDFDRELLARALVVGSVANQRDLREDLARLQVPILWIAGAKDAKYASLAQECAALNPIFSNRTLDAGHRVPWGNVAEFQAALHQGTQ